MTHRDVTAAIWLISKIALQVVGFIVAVFLTLYLVFVVFILVIDFGWEPFRSLPTDEEMIAHLQSHRADFEQLVQIYREYPQLPSRGGMVGFDEQLPRIKAIMGRINVNGIRGDLQTWTPYDPLLEKARDAIERSTLPRKTPRGNPDGCKFTGVMLSYTHQPVRRFEGNFPPVFKGYYYTPFPARVEKGWLITPRGREIVVQTLNSDPAELMPGICVYRQIEPQWFIEMSQADK